LSGREVFVQLAFHFLLSWGLMFLVLRHSGIIVVELNGEGNKEMKEVLEKQVGEEIWGF
jgi:hypothetical protein